MHTIILSPIHVSSSSSQSTKSFPQRLHLLHIPESQACSLFSQGPPSKIRILISKQIPVDNAFSSQVLVDLQLADTVQELCIECATCNQQAPRLLQYPPPINNCVSAFLLYIKYNMRTQANSSHNRVVGVSVLMAMYALAREILVDQAVIRSRM